MAKNNDSLIIIKKVVKAEHGHHGGSWKIAYADFITAMMAFFLLMWLLASLNKAQLEGISEYFKQPLRIASIGGDTMGASHDNVHGGGTDFTKKEGQVKKIMGKEPSEELMKLQKLKSDILINVDKDPALANLKNRLLLDVVSEGLRIQLIDNKNRPMFDIGSEDMNPEMKQLFAKIAKLLNDVPNKISIQGHTDANPYNDPEDLTQSNWELSTKRANAARRALIEGSMPEEKVMEVTGFASSMLLDKVNPLNPNNRRITIIVMKKAEENRILQGH